VGHVVIHEAEGVFLGRLLHTRGILEHVEEVRRPGQEESNKEGDDTRLQFVQQCLHYGHVKATCVNVQAAGPAATSALAVELAHLFHSLADDAVDQEGCDHERVERAVEGEAEEQEAAGDAVGQQKGMAPERGAEEQYRGVVDGQAAMSELDAACYARSSEQVLEDS